MTSPAHNSPPLVSIVLPCYVGKPEQAELLGRTPLARWGTPAEVGAAARYLCSPDAAFVTGVILPVDGGYLIA